ncbi:MAG: hypothetical protein ABIR87_08365 [Sphingomicrobium sp.]
MPEPKAEPAWVAQFLAALGACGNVTRSAALAGVDTTGPYNRRARYPGFRDAWDRVVAEREARAAPGSGDDDGQEPLHQPRIESVVPLPPQERGAELSVSAGGARRVAGSRWSKAAEEVFLTELTINANVQRAAAAAGFSAAAIYKRRVRDAHFAAGWDAAIAVGRTRLESFLIVQAERNFDPEAMPIGEGQPKVTVGEALGILKHKPAAPAAAASASAHNWVLPEEEPDPQRVQEAADRILLRLRRLREIDEKKKLAAGWTRYGEDWVPPGWVKLDS